VTLFIPFVEMSSAGGTGAGLGSRGPDEGGEFVDFFRVAEFAVELVHLQGTGRDLAELIGVGAVGALHSAVEFGRTGRKNEQMDTALLAGLFELSGKLGAAVDLHRPDGKQHTVLFSDALRPTRRPRSVRFRHSPPERERYQDAGGVLAGFANLSSPIGAACWVRSI
jgi:hypothetical protein